MVPGMDFIMLEHTSYHLYSCDNRPEPKLGEVTRSCRPATRLHENAKSFVSFLYLKYSKCLKLNQNRSYRPECAVF